MTLSATLDGSGPTSRRGTEVSPADVLRPLSVGPDGHAMLVRDGDGERAWTEVRVLSFVRRPSARWTAIEHSLQRAALLRHPGTRAVRSVEASGDFVQVVLEGDGSSTLAHHLGPAPWPRAAALHLAEGIAHTLASAHRVGLVHGRLCPRTVVLEDEVAWLEFTGIDVLDPDAFDALDLSCRAPGQVDDDEDDPALDVYALGVILERLLRGESGASSIVPPDADRVWSVIARATSPRAAHRPTAAELCLELRDLANDRAGAGARTGAEASGVATGASVTGNLVFGDDAMLETMAGGVRPEAAPTIVEAGDSLGRFRLLRRLGGGGMGDVFEARDEADGQVVAIKVLKRHANFNTDFVRRFRKEARVLEQLKSEYVCGLIEANIDRGVHFLALEYVPGPTLAAVVDRSGKLTEREALAVAADICRALVEPHRLGIVHRDIKPENVMFVSPAAAEDLTGTWAGARIKLCDFGIARQVEQTATLAVTRDGTALGTPVFMAPEQCSSGRITPATDVYALGVTLFMLIAGRPPFEAEESLALLVKHVNEPAPPLEKLVPEVSGPTAALVARALSKDPAQRCLDAGEMLDAIERIRHGAPAAELALHPALPTASPSEVTTLVYSWNLVSAPSQLWPVVSDTNRMNRVVGMAPPKFELRPLPQGGSAVRVSNRVAGADLNYLEEPFEWIEGRKWSVLRLFDTGVIRWMMVTLDLEKRPEGGTKLTYTLRFVPRHAFGRWLAMIEIALRQKPALDRLFKRTDATLAADRIDHPGVDVFQPVVNLSRRAAEKIDRVLERLRSVGTDATVAGSLGAFIRHASDQEVARIRPLALAQRFGLDETQTVAACLHATRHGLFVLLWDVLCPLCRVPSNFVDSLRQLEDHGHCSACNTDYPLDFAETVELVFRVSPDVRPVETRTYCIGGPSNAPHVAAQVRLGAGERFQLPLNLVEGPHRVRSPQLPQSLELRITPRVTGQRHEIAFGTGIPADGASAELSPGAQRLLLHNTLDHEIVVRVERMVPRSDALTAARAAAMAPFRELFPQEVLAPGQLVSVTNVALLVTDLEGAAAMIANEGDARAFEIALQQFRAIGDVVTREGGAVLKTVGCGLVAAFDTPLAAVRAAVKLGPALARDPRTRALSLRAVVHSGTALAATVNDRLDYFGATVQHATELLGQIPAGTLALGRSVADDGAVAEMLAQGHRTELVGVTLGGATTWAVRVLPMPA